MAARGPRNSTGAESLKPPTTRDARGRTVPLCSPEDVPDEAGPDILAAAIEANRDSFRRLAAAWVGSFAVVILVNFIWELLSTGGLGSPAAPFKGVGWLFASIVLGQFFAGLGADAAHEKLTSECLAHARCPTCIYDLSAIPIEPDGCRVCPECSGAWAVPPDALETRARVARPVRWVGIRIRLLDSRGRVRIRPTSLREELRVFLTALNPASALGREVGGGLPAIGCIGLVVVYWFAQSLLAASAVSGAALALTVPIAAVVACGFLRITLVYHARLRLWHRAFPRALAEGWCPACSHSLTGLIPESDGCRVCPECGAAWRLPAPAASAAATEAP